MTPTWILVADSARARLFTVLGNGSAMEEVASFANPDGRIAQSELRRDRLPRVNESMGGARHAIEPHTSLRDKSMHRFANLLGNELQQRYAAHRCEKLVLVAGPRFLGALHGALSDPLRQCVVAEIRRNLTSMQPAKIREHLPVRLAAA